MPVQDEPGTQGRPARADEAAAGSLRFQTKADAAHAELRRRILDGSLPPGSTLNQEQLAAELGVSTTPLREAIRRLGSEGLVTYRAHKDVVVIPVGEADLADIYEIRERLDALAAQFAAERHTAVEGDRIRAARDALASSPENEPLELNRRFHRAIYMASHNHLLVEILEGLWDRSDRHRRLLRSVALGPVVVDEHFALADAILEGRGEMAGTLMAQHVRWSFEAIREQAGREVDE
jgi:DNA-binding GntR family transcriptional regulator